MHFTGVGSRAKRAPKTAQDLLREIARQLSLAGLTGRSGAADGIDAAVEAGIDAAGGKKEIYLPWKGFNNSTSTLFEVTKEALALAATVHPAWVHLSQGEKKLHGRNTYQVLGKTLDTPSLLTVCWTPDGCESERERKKDTGGTATAIVLSERNRVPVFNLNRPGSRRRLVQFMAAHGIRLELPEEPASPTQTPLF